MSDKFTFSSAGEIQEVEFALARAGYTHPEVKELTKGAMLGLVREVISGKAEICRIERLASTGTTSVQSGVHVIDCNADPFIPNGWSVEEHRKGGSITWDPKQVKFYLSDPQKKGKSIEGNKLRKELTGKPVLNANVLDYLLKNPQLIPEAWKEKTNGYTTYIFFWGTIYRNSGGDLYVRYLYWRDGSWHWDYLWLGHVWFGSHPAAVLAS